MTHLDWIQAAQLVLPADARATGLTRIHRLGLRFGPQRPYRFVVARDLHLDIEDIMLHRTERLPPADDHDVTPAAAFIAFCAHARVIDAVQVGDWLLHRGHMTAVGLRELAAREAWRLGAPEALWVSRHLDGRSRSLPESEVRAIVVFAGLPAPEVNQEIRVDGRVVAVGDLVWLIYRLVAEYEGGHHQSERSQYLSDIDRYAILRELGLEYVQVTKESKARPATLVSALHRALVAHGHRGPAPTFGLRYQSLFAPISDAVPESEVARRPRG